MYVLLCLALTIPWIIDTAQQHDSATKTATWIVIFAMHSPFLVKTGQELLREEGLDKLKVAVGFVQVLAASKITFRLDFPINFSWLVDLCHMLLSFDFFIWVSNMVNKIGCVQNYTFYERWKAASYSPLAVLIILFSVQKLRSYRRSKFVIILVRNNKGCTPTKPVDVKRSERRYVLQHILQQR
eukprot:COSAG01_NODE_34354_length_549_cov_0.793333_1_plen_183_part_11